MCGQWNIDDWKDDAKYLVLDDIDFRYIGGSRKALWGANNQIVLTDKYRRKRTFRWGRPLIFLCNPEDDPRYLRDKHGNPEWNNWYDGNTVVIEINNRMY